MKLKVNLLFIFLSSLFLLSFTSSVAAFGTEKPLVLFDAPCIETVEPLPYDPSHMYMSYHEYQMVISSGIGVPGINYPNAYLYVHEIGSFQNQISISDALSFNGGEDTNTTIASVPKGFNLQNLDPFFPLCTQNGVDIFVTGNYSITVVTLENGIPEPYHQLHPELYPSNIFNSEFTVSAFHTFQCTFFSLQEQESDKLMKNELKHEPISNVNNTNYSFYPNPFREYLNLTINEASLKGYTIFNSYGKRIISSKIQESITLNTEALPPGTYIIQLHFFEKTITEKIIKI